MLPLLVGQPPQERAPGRAVLGGFLGRMAGARRQSISGGARLAGRSFEILIRFTPRAIGAPLGVTAGLRRQANGQEEKNDGKSLLHGCFFGCGGLAGAGAAALPRVTEHSVCARAERDV